MTIEENLISHCGQMSFCDDAGDTVRKIIDSNLDWDYIVRKSKKEKLSCIMYHQLNSIKNDIVPPHALASLREEYYTNSARNTVAFMRAKRILTAFSDNAIEAIVLKGLFLAEHIYKNIALRAMTDIDILIRKEDLRRANEMLVSLGYSVPAQYDFFLNYPGVSAINTIMYDAPGSGNPSIHLHWHLINSTWPLERLVDKITMERIWRKALPVTIDGVGILSLSPEHLLIYLCQHAFNHYFDKLILACDIAHVLRFYTGRLDWGMVVEEAENFGVSQILYYSLYYTHRLLGFEIPQLKRLEPVYRGTGKRAAIFLINKGVRHYGLSYFVYCSLQKGVLAKVRFLARTFFPPRHILAHSLNLSLRQIQPLHYCRRLFAKFAFLLRAEA